MGVDIATTGLPVGVKHVVDDFAIMQVPYRVRTRSPGCFDHDDHIVGVAVVRGTEGRIVDVRNRILRNRLTDVHARG